MSSGYTRGRRAFSSAEVPHNYRPGAGQQLRREVEEHRRTLPGRIRQMEEDKGKGTRIEKNNGSSQTIKT